MEFNECTEENQKTLDGIIEDLKIVGTVMVKCVVPMDDGTEVMLHLQAHPVLGSQDTQLISPHGKESACGLK